MELKYFWQQKKHFVNILFFMNRYYSEAAFCLIAFMLLSPKSVDPTLCRRAALSLAFVGVLPITFWAESLLVLRVWAIYGRNKIVLAFLLTFLACELSIGIWLYAAPGHGAVPLPQVNAEPFQMCLNAPSPTLP